MTRGQFTSYITNTTLDIILALMQHRVTKDWADQAIGDREQSMWIEVWRETQTRTEATLGRNSTQRQHRILEKRAARQAMSYCACVIPRRCEVML